MLLAIPTFILIIIIIFVLFLVLLGAILFVGARARMNHAETAEDDTSESPQTQHNS